MEGLRSSIEFNFNLCFASTDYVQLVWSFIKPAAQNGMKYFVLSGHLLASFPGLFALQGKGEKMPAIKVKVKVH